MKTFTDEELKKLTGLLRQVIDVLAASEEPEPVVSPEVTKRVRDLLKGRVCLQCKKQKDERYRSGVCISCYQRSRRLMRLGKVTETVLVEKGLWTNEGSQPGRRAEATDLDKLLAEQETAPNPDIVGIGKAIADVLNDAAEEEKKKRTRKKKGES